MLAVRVQEGSGGLGGLGGSGGSGDCKGSGFGIGSRDQELELVF